MALHKRDNLRRPWRFAPRRSLRVIALLLVPALVLLAGCAFPGSNDESLDDVSWFSIRMSIMTTCVQFLLVVAIVLLYYKMNRLVAKLNDISKDASKFLRMGMTFFKKK